MNEQLSEQAEQFFKDLGHFGFTDRGDSLKGWAYDSDCDGCIKTYLYIEDLELMVASAQEAINIIKARLEKGLTKEGAE